MLLPILSNINNIIIIIDTNSAVDCFITDLKNDVKEESTTSLRPEVQDTHKKDVQMNTITLKNVVTNGSRSKNCITSKILHDLEDRREEGVELESDNFKSILNPTIPLYANNNTENLINDEELTKDSVIRLEKITIYHYYVYSKLYVHLLYQFSIN